jgi:hypothetical protein
VSKILAPLSPARWRQAVIIVVFSEPGLEFSTPLGMSDTKTPS